jgi:AbrB family looped-hinge helix DNA binding protein
MKKKGRVDARTAMEIGFNPARRVHLPVASLMGLRARWGSWATLRSASAWVWLIQRLKRVNDAIGIVRKLLKKIEIPVQPYSTTMSLTKVSHKFQVVIPKEVRELLGISKGDILQVYGKNHEIVMKKTDVKKPLSLKNLKGLGKDIWKDIDVEEYIKKERESW